MLRKFTVFAFVLLLGVLLASVAVAQDETFSLTIMHTNDVHAHHDPNGNGDGGAAIQAAVVRQIRAEAANSLLLDGGDRFTGTLYHVQYRGQDSAQIMNLVGYDGMTLGNHEFDDGDETLAAFVDAVNFPVVTANVDFSESPVLAGKIDPWTIIEVGGQQIGVIGLVTPDAPVISSPGAELVFNNDLVAVVQVAVDELTAQGVNKIILVTHIGLNLDMEVAAGVSGVDIIVGGHSHTLLGNAYVASVAEYPVVMESASGEPIIIVQAGEYDTYLGRLDVEFDAAGLLTGWDGDTILLSRYITPDADMTALLSELAAPIEELRNQPVGESGVFLVGDRSVCRVEECNLGNLIADAVQAETGAQIVFQNGGGIRADIDEGTVTLGEVLTVLPFGNLVSTLELKGSDVVAALENGVSTIALDDAGMVQRGGAAGRFPQVAGLRFSVDPTLEAGSRVSNVEVWVDGAWAPLDPEAVYTVATNDFMRRGGDGYTMFAENAINPYDFGRPLDQVLADYITANGPVAPEVEGRITYVNAEVQPR